VIIPPIVWTEFVAATVRYADQVRHRNIGHESPSALAYTVLTMCRALRTVRAQANGSKQEAAAWTREQLPQWAWLIDIALLCRQAARGAIPMDPAPVALATDRGRIVRRERGAVRIPGTGGGLEVGRGPGARRRVQGTGRDPRAVAPPGAPVASVRARVHGNCGVGPRDAAAHRSRDLR